MQDAKKADGDKMRDSSKTKKQRKSIWKLVLSSLSWYLPHSAISLNVMGVILGKD